ncbi:MAG: TIGR00300 family protein [Candidatus Nezhaarchaeales archaeon]|nr:MAG: TIGR00300 family protein [Candidatus Nezhaarchaeota archaeon WYZ-LMO8]TDA37393.1 MAG: TIGR00300 family protein [Candidatus Nezhaarchaeota archaeon WYZ-LMO7]
MSNQYEHAEEVLVEGHLIDSMILTRILDRIMELEGDFEIIEFKVGKRKHDYSRARLIVKGRSKEHLDEILKELYRLGAVPVEYKEVELKPAPKDGVAPDGFYSTSNYPTEIFYQGSWIPVEDVMMDKVIVVDPQSKRATCIPLREIKKGDLVVVGERGIRVRPPERPRESLKIFEFMSSKVSPEKPSTSIVKHIARDMHSIKRRGGKIAVVAGPAVVHTGGAPALAKIIRLGYVDVLLAGNALAVHDVEYALFGTSLGIKVDEGVAAPKGHRNHLAAINEIMKVGSLRDAVEKCILNRGIIYECIVKGVPYVLAGSIRDDGPLPDVITDVVEAQKAYRKHLKGIEMVLMLASTLHSIAVGNMLPATVKVVCVDINPATIIKLLDRGTAHAVGVVSDVGVFLKMLADELWSLSAT